MICVKNAMALIGFRLNKSRKKMLLNIFPENSKYPTKSLTLSQLGWGAHGGSQRCQKSTSMHFQGSRSCANVRISWGKGEFSGFINLVAYSWNRTFRQPGAPTVQSFQWVEKISMKAQPPQNEAVSYWWQYDFEINVNKNILW